MTVSILILLLLNHDNKQLSHFSKTSLSLSSAEAPTGYSNKNNNNPFFQPPSDTKGSLSKDDGNGKKTIDLEWQNNNLARASPFFLHFLAVVARRQRESV